MANGGFNHGAQSLSEIWYEQGSLYFDAKFSLDRLITKYLQQYLHQYPPHNY
jgi:hypothetical protein